MAFPKEINIQVINKDGKSISADRVFFVGRLLAAYRNNYSLGPFWTNCDGNFIITRELVEEEIKTAKELCPMDYGSELEQCKPLIEIELLDQDGINRLIKGALTWGVSGPDLKFWKTPEEKIAFIKQNNNHLVLPVKTQIDLSIVNPTDVIQRTIVTRQI